MNDRRQKPGPLLRPAITGTVEGSQRPLVLRIEKPIYGGAGLARDGGKAIFVPYTLPGELVTALVTQNRASFAEAALDEIKEPSPARVTPPCHYFGRCGGCHYQHAGYLAQLAMKAAILEETLTRARLAPLPPIVTHASEPFGYRNRVRLHFNPSASTVQSVLGYHGRGSHQLVAVDECPIAAPELEQALHQLASASIEQKCGSFFSHAEWSINHDASELLLALWLRPQSRVEEAGARLTRLCETLRETMPALHGACVHAPPPAESEMLRAGSRSPKYGSPAPRQRTGKSLDRALDEPVPGTAQGSPIAAWGASHLTYIVGSFEYRVSLGSFFQVNRTLLESLVGLATDGCHGRVAWDLYAGVGLFSRVLTQGFEQVVAVEGAPLSFADLRFHLPAPHQPIRSSTAEFLRRAAAGGRQGQHPRAPRQPGFPQPDFVLVDPPRAGLGEEVTRLLAQIGPPKITYVSCDPATLSRDLRALVDSGYKLEQLHLIDLFPQTFHLETLAMLSRT